MLSEIISEECEEELEKVPGERLSATNLEEVSDGEFAFVYLTDDGVETKTLSDEVNKTIVEAFDKLNELYNTNIKVSRRNVKWVPENDEVFVSIIMSHTYENPQVFQSLCEKVVSDNSDINDAKLVEAIEVTRSPYLHNFTDSTVSFKTKKPHERIANYDTLDEYISARAERGDVTEKELRDRDYYPDHYHPQSSEFKDEVLQIIGEELYHNIEVEDPAMKDITGANAERGGELTGWVTVYASVGSL